MFTYIGSKEAVNLFVGASISAGTLLQVAGGVGEFLAALLAPPEETSSPGEENHQPLALGALLVM